MSASDTFARIPADPSAKRTFGLSGPATTARTVSPNDATDLPEVSRALYIGTAGNLSVIMADGMTANFTSIPAGTILPIRVSRVRNTGTTAGAIVTLV